MGNWAGVQDLVKVLETLEKFASKMSVVVRSSLLGPSSASKKSLEDSSTSLLTEARLGEKSSILV